MDIGPSDSSVFGNVPVPPRNAQSMFAITVNYGEVIEHLIAVGPCWFVPTNVPWKKFTQRRHGIAHMEIVLYNAGRRVTSTEAIKDLVGNRLRPAEIHELLSFGHKYPAVQKESSVVALGSVWRRSTQGPLVPCLSTTDGLPSLRLLPFEKSERLFVTKWHESCYFIAARF